MTALLWLTALAAAPALPGQVTLKTPQLSFTSKYEFGIDQGRIWWKEPGKAWELFPPAGLPAGKGVVTPPSVVAITTDGENLAAIELSGRVHYYKLDEREWKQWGPLLREGPLYIDLAAGEVPAMSHRKVAFEDVDGNPHPVIVGVTTLYVLSQGGRRLEYTDPWLPPDRRHFMCLPEHGRFRAAGFSASASTVFVMDSAGNAYTRLADFDSLGLDPVLRYGWDRARRTGVLDNDVYSLPADAWVKQPALPGPSTTTITIVQTGLGNQARELRVGAPDGYWTKTLGAATWEHVDGPPAPGRAIDPLSDPSLPPHTRALQGTFDGQPVTLEEFAPDCSPATLVVGSARLPLHFLQDWEPGKTSLSGALYAADAKLPLFHGRPFIEVELKLDGDDVTVRELFRPRALAFKVTLLAGPPVR